MIALFINVTNSNLDTVSIRLTEYLRLSTHSKEAQVIIKVSALANLVNTCLMSLLVSASFVDFDGGSGWL